MSTADLCVVGGGPAGLATAIAARQRGLDVVVVDSSRPPIDKVCGEGIMPDGVTAARALGIQIENAGARPFRGIRFREGATSVEASFPVGHGYGVRRLKLHQLIIQRAEEAGVHLKWGTRVAGISIRGVETDDGMVNARWVVGADGGTSNVRRWAGLDERISEVKRYGFRRHFHVAPWTDHMELHWSDNCQLYITPVSDSDVCVVLLSRHHSVRMDQALPLFPEALRRLSGASFTPEKGALSVSRRLRNVALGNVALVGDASGSVDAITGEGMCLLFQQAVALADAMVAGDLQQYREAHRQIGRRPRMMASMMLLLDGRRFLRTRVLTAMAASPRLFGGMLAMHIGELSPLGCATNGLELGWRMLTS